MKNKRMKTKGPPPSGRIQAFDKVDLSLVVSVFALVVSVLSYYGPQHNAAGRIQGQVDAAKYFKIAMFAGCDSKQKSEDTCEVALDLAITGTEEAMKSLDAERTNLSISDFNEAYQAIYGTYLEAKRRKFMRENPGVPLPEIQLGSKEIEKIRILEKKL